MNIKDTLPVQKGKQWTMAKTLLLIYSDIDYYIQSQEDRLNIKILQSTVPTKQNTEQILENIINICVKLNILQNLKKGINTAIDRMPNEEALTLKKYFCRLNEKKTANDIAKEMNISERSFYRKLDNATANFAAELPEIGINSFTWADLMLNFSYFREIFVKMLAL